jgi:excisionase family DNA binding protein
MPEDTGWLSLKEAAAHLGIHETTLRRWADSGEIPVMLTPGGHRRFAVADLNRFAQDRRRLKMVSGLEQLWAEQALHETRQAIVQHPELPWLSSFSPEDRERKRLLGRRLMGLILQYLSSDDVCDDILAEAQAIGREYAEDAISLGLPLVEALQATLFFRDTIVEAAIQLPDVAHVRPESNTRLLRRVNTLLNTVQLAIAATYDLANKK